MEEIPFNVIAEEIEDKRRRLRAQYGTLCDDISAILFRHDPIGINFENKHR